MAKKQSITLAEACEPLFLAVCRINRAARPRGNAAAAVKLHPGTVRAQLNAAFTEMQELAVDLPDDSFDPNLVTALKCFADLMVARGGYDFSEGWDFISKNECAAPGQFYIEQIRLTLDDPSEAASERLGVYHACLCMGCEGHYFPDATHNTEFQQLYRDVAQRVEARTRAPAARQICRDAYDGVFRQRPPRPITENLKPILAVSVALLTISFIVAYASHVYFVHDLEKDLDTVNKALVKPAPSAEPVLAAGKSS